MKGQSHPQRGPGQALISGGVAETGLGEDSSLRGGAGVLGVLEWPWREGMVPCGPSPLPGHLWPWCQGTGAERAPEKSSGWSGGSRHVWPHLSARLVCAQSEGHTQDIAPPVPPPCHCPRWI